MALAPLGRRGNYNAAMRWTTCGTVWTHLDPNGLVARVYCAYTLSEPPAVLHPPPCFSSGHGHDADFRQNRFPGSGLSPIMLGPRPGAWGNKKKKNKFSGGSTPHPPPPSFERGENPMFLRTSPGSCGYRSVKNTSSSSLPGALPGHIRRGATSRSASALVMMVIRS